MQNAVSLPGQGFVPVSLPHQRGRALVAGQVGGVARPALHCGDEAAPLPGTTRGGRLRRDGAAECPELA